MNALNTEQLYKLAPSLFTRGAALNTSERYQPIATSDIIDVMLQEGFYVTKAVQSASRNEEKKSFAKHMIRFRHSDYRDQGGGSGPKPAEFPIGLILVKNKDKSGICRPRSMGHRTYLNQNLGIIWILCGHFDFVLAQISPIGNSAGFGLEPHLLATKPISVQSKHNLLV